MTKQNILTGLFPGNYASEGRNLKTEKILFYIVLAISFLTVLIIYFIADSTYDTGDGLVHYQIARYSWKYPHLLLDLWGKPFFTLISSPFAQFGLKGMYVFQALNSVAISLFLFSIASKIKLKFKWTIPVFVFFAPVYFAAMNSGLAEIFFGSLFMFSAWLVFNKKYYTSAVIASLIPFVRPEAYVVIPLLAAIYIYRRKFLAIPLLATAVIIYTIIGYFHFNDILWIIDQNYQLVGDNYAGMKGSYFHYFGVYDEIWGTVYTVLLLFGIGMILSQVYKLVIRKTEHEFVEEVFVLFLGCTIGCFVLHSLLCGMPGILNNLGLLRYLAALIPGSALIALIGLNMINLPVFKKIKSFKPVIVVIIVSLVILSPFTQWYYPFTPNNEELVMKQMGDYIKTSWPDFKKICSLHPSLPAMAEIDPYDENKKAKMHAANFEYLNQLPDSTLFLWDSHFMEIEGKVSYEWLIENPNFIFLKHLIFANEELPFEACLFIRVDNPNPVPIEVPVEIVSPDGTISHKYKLESTKYDFDNSPHHFPEWDQLKTLFSDRDAVLFSPEIEFGPKFHKKSGNINLGDGLKSVNLKFNINPIDTYSNLLCIVDVRSNDSIVSWEGLNIKQEIVSNQWNSIELYHSYQEPIKNENLSVIVYIWNKGKQEFYIDDFRIDFGYIIDSN